jgi:hypothetical protein
MNKLWRHSKMNIDSINSFFQNVSIALLVCTALSGTITIITNKIIAKRDRARLAITEQITAEANQKAAEANQKAAEAAKGTAIAVADASAAKERTVKLELETVQQREKTAKAERELFELKEKLKPRQLSDASRLSLIAALALSNPKGLVKIQCISGDNEGIAYANQMNEALKTAGWPTTEINAPLYIGGSNPIGFGIAVHSKATTPQYAVALQRAFINAGINLGGIESDEIPEGEVWLMIGNKPQ